MWSDWKLGHWNFIIGLFLGLIWRLVLEKYSCRYVSQIDSSASCGLVRLVLIQIGLFIQHQFWRHKLDRKLDWWTTPLATQVPLFPWVLNFRSGAAIFCSAAPDRTLIPLVCAAASLSRQYFCTVFVCNVNCPLTAFLLMLDAIMEEKDVFSHWFQWEEEGHPEQLFHTHVIV
jgi:hypothetical protein